MSPKVTYVPDPSKADGKPVGLQGSGPPTIPVVVGGVYVDVSTGNVYTGSITTWMLITAGAGQQVYNGVGVPVFVPTSTAAIYYDTSTSIIYLRNGAAWV